MARWTDDLETRFWKKVARTPDGCWEWQGAKKDGYGAFRMLNAKGVPQSMRAQRAALIILGVDVLGLDACHSCDNPPCVRPSHLFAATHNENIVDMNRKGRHWKSLSRPYHAPMSSRRKFTEDDIREIRITKTAQVLTARRFGVSQAAISSIKKGKMYGWVV